MTRPLNPRLYRMLNDYFGHVRVSNEGIRQSGFYAKSALTGVDQLNLVEPGEYYQVCCPYCSDTRFRLFLNHMWGHKDKHGNRNLWMAICYNENCLDSYERKEDLLNRLTDQEGESIADGKILEGKELDPDEVIIDWPGPVIRVDRLPEEHKAVQYLRSRSFDPQVIGRFYNVHYCQSSFRWLAADRLIIPMYLKGQLKGWQARFIGEMNWKQEGAPPKYYTCPGSPRRHLIYNMANARRYRTGVIMEGPTDVWAFGPMGICTLGSTMTNYQRRDFHTAFKDYAAVLLYDPDAQDKPGTRKIIDSFTGQFDRGFATVTLPGGRDPGSLDRQFLREYVAAEAKKQGVKVSWRLR